MFLYSFGKASAGRGTSKDDQMRLRKLSLIGYQYSGAHVSKAAQEITSNLQQRIKIHRRAA